MAAARSLRPLARAVGSQRTTFLRTSQPARFFNSETAPSLYAAHATVTGARNGHIKADNLDLQLAMPSKLGGAGGKTNPEELFAAGYGACFQSAMNACAGSLGVKMPSKSEDSVVETTVHLAGDMKELDIGIRVEMLVKVKGMKKEDIEKVVAKAKEVCPYSRATAGNVYTTVKVQAE